MNIRNNLKFISPKSEDVMEILDKTSPTKSARLFISYCLECSTTPIKDISIEYHQNESNRSEEIKVRFSNEQLRFIHNYDEKDLVIFYDYNYIDKHYENYKFVILDKDDLCYNTFFCTFSKTFGMNKFS